MFEVHLHLNIFIIFVNLFFTANSEIPRTVLCADPACSVPISEAQGKISYTPSEEHVLGFKKGTKILITSKSKEKDGYWGARIGSRIGFVPSEFVKEVTVWKSMDMLQHEVPTISAPVPSVDEGNENLNQANFALNVGRGPENTMSDTPQGSSGSPLSNIINGDVHNMPSELLNETQNLQLIDSYKELTSNTASSSPQVHPVTEIPGNVIREEFMVEKKPETEGKTAKESVTKIISYSTDAEQKGGSLNSRVPETDTENLLVVTNSDSQLAEGVNHKQINLGEKINKEPETYKSNVNSNENSNEKSQGDNPKINTDNVKIVEMNEKENNHSVDSSNNLKTSGSDAKGSPNIKLEKEDAVEDLNILDDVSENIVSGAQGDSMKAPLIVEDKDPSFIPGKDGSITSENRPSMTFEHYANNWQNILPNHNEGVNVQAELKSDAGIVNEINETSINHEMNIVLNQTLAHDDMADVSAFDSTTSRSDSGSSSSSSSSSRSSIVSNSPTDASGNEIHVKPVNDNLKQSSLPSHQFQKDGDIPNIAEGVNVRGAQFGHVPQQGMPPNDFNSAGKPDPSSVHISLGQVPPYNYVRQRENSNTETTPSPVNVEASNSARVPSPIFINNDNNQAMYQQFGAATSESVLIKNMEYDGSQELINKDKDTSSEEQYGDVKQSGNNYEEMPSTEKPATPMPIQSEDVEKPPMRSTETPQPGIAEVATEVNFQYESTAQSPVELVMDTSGAAKNPSEISNFEFSTPVPPLAVAPGAYENAEEKDTETGEASRETSDGGGFFSNMGEKVLGWIGLGSKKQEPEPQIQQGNHFEETIFVESQSSEIYTKEKITAPDETCQAPDGTTVNCNDVPSDENNPFWSFWLDNRSITSTSSYNTFIYLVVTAVTVLLFTLGYYFIEKFRSDGPLIAKVNRLEQELLVSSKECLILKEELTNTKEKLNLFETSSNDKIITSLQQELEEAKKIKVELENNIEVLQQELDAATEAGLDLNKMLSEVLTQKGGSETLMESVEHLQAQLNNQQKIIDEMTSKLITKTNENQELQDELTAATEKIESLESEIEDLRGNLNVHLKDNEDVIKDLTTKNNELHLKVNQMNESKEKEIAKLKKNIAELEKKLKATSDSLKVKEEECNNLKDSVKKIKLKDGKSIDSLFETSRIKAELSHAAGENSSLKDRLRAEEDKFAKLDSEVKKLEEEIHKLKHISSEAEKEKTEAQTRLEVLSNYFKEKETQLQKELGLKEALWVQKQGDDSTIYEKIKCLEEEINSYKSQNEALKKEILDQERGLKAQITTLEKKAHENWIAARQAERKLEETKQEAAQLRNKMTLMEKNISNDLESSQHHRVNDELNGGDALSPLIHDTSSPILFPPPLPLDPNNSSLMPPGFIPPPMFMPPPPGGFMPPPPPFLPGDHRPPPLGRMSSPPLNNRFSPPPPDYAYDRMSTPPLSPSNRNYRSPNESDRDRERFRHRTPTSPSFRSRNWEEGPSTGMSGFRPITSERDSRRDHKGGSNLSSGHSSDSLDKSSRHSSRV